MAEIEVLPSLHFSRGWHLIAICNHALLWGFARPIKPVYIRRFLALIDAKEDAK
jgi:hypothetical protein